MIKYAGLSHRDGTRPLPGSGGAEQAMIPAKKLSSRPEHVEYNAAEGGPTIVFLMGADGRSRSGIRDTDLRDAYR